MVFRFLIWISRYSFQRQHEKTGLENILAQFEAITKTGPQELSCKTLVPPWEESCPSNHLSIPDLLFCGFLVTASTFPSGFVSNNCVCIPEYIVLNCLKLNYLWSANSVYCFKLNCQCSAYKSSCEAPEPKTIKD